MTANADKTIKEGLQVYKEKISTLKKGYVQEKFRIDQISGSFLGALTIRKTTSVEISTYRDQRLETPVGRTGRLLSPSSVRLEIALLSNFFDICMTDWGWADDNPCKKVRKPKVPPGRDRRLTAREERQILRYAFNHRNTELYAIVSLALSTAMRQGEILSLRWEHLEIQTGIAHLFDTKNGSNRDVPLSQRARDVLLQLEPKSFGKVFTYTPDGLKSTWRFMLQRLAIKDLRFHDLRHEAISRLFELGTLNVMEISSISGHKSLSMLKRYTHLKAASLVPKLEGQRSKARMAVINTLVPYPAKYSHANDIHTLHLLDFDNLIVEAPSIFEVEEAARVALLTRILILIREGKPLPKPDQYTELVKSQDIRMVAPLPLAA